MKNKTSQKIAFFTTILWLSGCAAGGGKAVSTPEQMARVFALDRVQEIRRTLPVHQGNYTMEYIRADKNAVEIEIVQDSTVSKNKADEDMALLVKSYCRNEKMGLLIMQGVVYRFKLMDQAGKELKIYEANRNTCSRYI